MFTRNLLVLSVAVIALSACGVKRSLQLPEDAKKSEKTEVTTEVKSAEKAAAKTKDAVIEKAKNESKKPE